MPNRNSQPKVSRTPLFAFRGIEPQEIDEFLAFLEELRADRGAFLARSFAPAEADEKGITWWTYAGGYVNNTVRYAFRVELGERATAQVT